MLMKPKISIVVPCFNVESYLSVCLDSILKQTFLDFELICVDDCSTDATAELLRSYLGKFAGRMKLITHATNKGQGEARNSGLAAASCEWIASVDSDDWIDPVMMERLYEAAVRYGADIVNTGFKQVSAEGVVEAEYGYQERIHHLSPGDNVFALCRPAFWNKLWRRSLFIEHGITFPATLFADLATTPRALSNAKTIAFVPGTPYNYRQRLGSITFSASFSHISNYVRVFSVLERYFSPRLSSDPKARLQFCEMVEGNIKYHVENVGDLTSEDAYADVAYLTALGYISYVQRAYGPVDRELPFFLGCYP
ncbi:MAG: glycosyltransferase [Prochlorococcaceae cyanobacterium]